MSEKVFSEKTAEALGLGRARCALLLSTLLLSVWAPEVVAEEEAEKIVSETAPEFERITLDTTQALSFPLDSEGDFLLYSLAQGGFWLLPEGCASIPLGGGDAMEEAQDALLEQHPDEMKDRVFAGLQELVCQGRVVAPEAVAMAWFYLGAGALMAENDADVDRYFQAIHLQGAQKFTPPELGQRLRDRYIATQKNSIETNVLTGLPKGEVEVYLDGLRLHEGGLPLAPVPHLIQFKSEGEQPYGQILWPTESGFRLGLTGKALTQGNLLAATQKRWMEDTIRYLRVNVGSEGGQDNPKWLALQESLSEEGVALEVLWRDGSGNNHVDLIEPKTLGKSASPEGAGIKKQAETEAVTVESASVPGPPEAPHRVAISLGSGVNYVRGTLFAPSLQGDVILNTELPFSVELGISGAVDHGQQGESLRGLISGRSGLRFALRSDIGLSATVGLLATTRGPDPKDPSVFIIEGMAGGWLRYSPPGLLPFDGLFFELGGTMAPGMWRSDGEGTEGIGTMAWFVVGFERR